MSKKLFRSRVNSKIGGVCGGLGEYLNLDPTLVRIIAILLVFADGVGVLAYAIAWIIMPKQPLDFAHSATETKPSNWNRQLPGLILVVLGVMFLTHNLFWWFNFHDLFWPGLLIVAGLYLIFNVGRKEITQNNNVAGSENGG